MMISHRREGLETATQVSEISPDPSRSGRLVLNLAARSLPNYGTRIGWELVTLKLLRAQNAYLHRRVMAAIDHQATRGHPDYQGSNPYSASKLATKLLYARNMCIYRIGRLRSRYREWIQFVRNIWVSVGSPQGWHISRPGRA